MRPLIRAALSVAFLVLVAAAAGAQPITGIGTTITANVTLTTTTENVAVTSTSFAAPRETVNLCVWGWAQLTTGAATTAVVPRIRRGAAITGTLLGEATEIEIGATAADDEQFQMMACEERTGGGILEYSFTLDQIDATGNGTVLQAGIFVLVF